MAPLTRRRFIQVLGATGLAALPLVGGGTDRGSSRGKVVVVGAGYGGAIAAKYLRRVDPAIEVVLIEQDRQFISCPLSNEVLGGERDMASLTFGFQGLEAHGVKVVIDEVTAIDPAKKTVSTRGGQQLDYDRLVLSPGIQFRWDAIEGYDEQASEIIPHAWKAGPQTLLLKSQLQAMEDGGTVIIAAPPNPYRCPPGPYERAAQMAHYLKQHKPKSKVLILDAKDAFSKQALFQQGWEQHYPGMISWIPAASDGRVVRVDPKTRTLYTEFAEHQGAVVNVIPPQKAGRIAEAAGLSDASGWCPVDPRTFESTLHKDIHVIGDACIAGEMPKSAYAANTQAKVCVRAVAALLKGEPVPEPSYVNTCYSLITPDHGISVAGVYELRDGQIVAVKGSGGVSPLEAGAEDRKTEAAYARSWYANITADTFM